MQEERMEEFSRLIQSDDFIQFVQYLRVRSVNSLLGLVLCVCMCGGKEEVILKLIRAGAVH